MLLAVMGARYRARSLPSDAQSPGRAETDRVADPDLFVGRYLNSDVTTHLDTAALTDLGDDRVEIRGVRGSAPPATTKVAITGIGGWENSMLLALTGSASTRRPRSSSEPSTATSTPSTGSTRSRSTVSGGPSTIRTANTPAPSC